MCHSYMRYNLLTIIKFLWFRYPINICQNSVHHKKQKTVSVSVQIPQLFQWEILFRELSDYELLYCKSSHILKRQFYVHIVDQYSFSVLWLNVIYSIIYLKDKLFQLNLSNAYYINVFSKLTNISFHICTENLYR